MRFLESAAAMKPVRLYTTPICPYCVRAKSLLKSKGIPFTEIDVTDDAALREKMVEMAGGRRTVPEIFINGKIVGGYDELKALNDAAFGIAETQAPTRTVFAPIPASAGLPESFRPGRGCAARRSCDGRDW